MKKKNMTFLLIFLLFIPFFLFSGSTILKDENIKASNIKFDQNKYYGKQKIGEKNGTEKLNVTLIEENVHKFTNKIREKNNLKKSLMRKIWLQRQKSTVS